LSENIYTYTSNKFIPFIRFLKIRWGLQTTDKQIYVPTSI